MSLWSRIKSALARFMQGRNGADNLGVFTLIAGLVISLLSRFINFPILGYIGLALYIYTLFRMLSRNREKRMAENRKYLALSANVKTKTLQFVRRMKNRKDYKYFKCPNCKVLLRLKRGTGEKVITCVRCKHEFRQKA